MFVAGMHCTKVEGIEDILCLETEDECLFIMQHVRDQIR